MSRTKHWRESRDYRAEYFRESPGLLGFIWFCSQCGKPLLGKSNVQVDHIYPPSRLAVKKYDKHGRLVKNDSLLARAMNTTLNTTAICKKCNQKKSDKVNAVVTTKGIIAKVIETLLFKGQSVVVLLIGLLLKGLFFFFQKSYQLLSYPLRASTSWKVKVLTVVFYIALAYYAVSSLSN